VDEPQQGFAAVMKAVNINGVMIPVRCPDSIDSLEEVGV